MRFLGFQLFMANFKLATRGPRRASVPPLTRLKLGACGAASAAAAASAGAGAFVQAAGGHKPGFFHERLGLMGGLGRMAAGGRQTCHSTVC